VRSTGTAPATAEEAAKRCAQRVKLWRGARSLVRRLCSVRAFGGGARALAPGRRAGRLAPFWLGSSGRPARSAPARRAARPPVPPCRMPTGPLPASPSPSSVGVGGLARSVARDDGEARMITGHGPVAFFGHLGDRSAVGVSLLERCPVLLVVSLP